MIPERTIRDPKCRSCGKLLLDMTMADGCPCAAPRGINHGLVPREVCTCTECDPEQTGASRFRLPSAPEGSASLPNDFHHLDGVHPNCTKCGGFPDGSPCPGFNRRKTVQSAQPDQNRRSAVQPGRLVAVLSDAHLDALDPGKNAVKLAAKTEEPPCDCPPSILALGKIMPSCRKHGSLEVREALEQAARQLAPDSPEGRPTFHRINMQYAWLLSRRSTCSRLQVGCVITSPDFRKVISVGYNGGAAGQENACESLEPGMCGHLHAEENAIINCDAPRATEKVVFCTDLPCAMCAKRFVNLGNVVSLFYERDYRRREGLDILKRAGVNIYKMNPAEPPAFSAKDVVAWLSTGEALDAILKAAPEHRIMTDVVAAAIKAKFGV